MKVNSFAAVVAVTVAAAAQAGTKPLYAPVPAWVLPAPAIDPAKTDGVPRVILDQQQRLADGQVWSYVDTASRVTSQQSLLEAGTIILGWQPDEGDLIVHRIAILRGTETIDLLAEKEPLTVLRRETGLESLVLDGVLTATMPAKGLQVGDILRVTYSVTQSDPALKGKMQSTATLLPDQTQVGFARIRVLWPAGQDVKWKALAKVGEAKVRRVGAFDELSVATPMPKQPDLPNDAPARFQPLPLVELSTFRDWADVSRTMAPLYAPVAFASGSPLAAEAARIAAATPDPLARAALALESVQGNIRYFANGLDHGNYVPQPPDKTWAIRSGDCKAKTVLLLSLLTALGIPAEPVLANPQLGDFLPGRLPSAAAFNHILVAATIAGRIYWLDGTGLGTRPADLGDTPNLRHVLPLRTGGAGLMPVVTHADARPLFVGEIDRDATAGIGLPTPVHLTVTIRGALVEELKTADRGLGGDERKAMIDKVVNQSGTPMITASRRIDYDAAAGTATIRVDGLVGGDWRRDDQRYSDNLDAVVAGLKFDGERGRPEWRTIPVATQGVQSIEQRARVHLPDGGRGFTLDGDTTLPPMLAGVALQRTASLAGGVASMTDRVDFLATEVPVDQIGATRAALAQAKSRPLKILAPRDYPHRWQVVRDARAAGRLRPIEAAYAAALADATVKEPLLLARAEFHESVYDYAGAVADLDAVIAKQPTAATLGNRSYLRFELGHAAAALADARAGYALDPGSNDALGRYLGMLAENGQLPAALTLLDEQLTTAGERKSALLSAKADLLARDHQTEAALAAADAAIAAKPGSASRLNARCWLKGTLGVQLDTALKDCTKALELGNATAPTLDSRAMVYLKLGRLDDALIDVEAALLERPDQAGSLFLRGVIEARLGKRAASTDDLTGARMESPRIDEEYRRYGVTAG